MIFYSFFKTLIGKRVEIELKNDMVISGNLISVDQFLNMKLAEIEVEDVERFPHMLAVKGCFIRGSVIRYVKVPEEAVETDLLQDASRKEASNVKSHVQKITAAKTTA